MQSEEIGFLSLSVMEHVLQSINAFTSQWDKQREGTESYHRKPYQFISVCRERGQVSPPGVKKSTSNNTSNNQNSFCSFVWVLRQNMCCGNEKLLNIGGRYCGKGVNSLRDLWLVTRKTFCNKIIVSYEQSSVWARRSNCEQMCYSK